MEKTKRPIRWLYGAFALALALLVAWGLWPGPKPVEVARVGYAPLTVGFSEEARTRLRHRYTVTAPVDGELQRVSLQPGDAVKAGQEIARLHPSRAALLDPATWTDARGRLATAEAERRAAAASLEAAKASRDRAQLLAARLDTLARSQQVAVAQRDEARSDLLAAQALVRSAEAALQAAGSRRDALQSWLELQGSDRHDRAQLAVLAPIDGRVIQRFAESEGVVRTSQPLFELGDPRDMEVVADVLTADAMKLRVGTPVLLRAGEDAPTLGRVSRIEPGAFTKVSALGVEEQRVRVIVELPAPMPALGDAYRVDAEFQVWTRPRVLAVPVAALFHDARAWAVYVVEDGRARRRKIGIGQVGRDFAECVSGLAEGAQVVLYPGDDIRDGDRVAPGKR